MKNSSIISRIVGNLLRNTKPSYMTSQEEVKLFLQKDTPEFKSIFKTVEYENMKMAVFGNKNKKSRIILYLHGGAYVNQLNYQHTVYCYLLSHILDAYVIAPAYPLIPEYSYVEAAKIVTNLYKSILEENKEIVIMGDSAGGGFALSLTESFAEEDLKLPEKVVVFSPWVNLSMKGKYSDEDDPILGVVGLREFGKLWAGKLETDDSRVSPLYSNEYPNVRTIIFVGENEIFYKDIKEFYDKICENTDSRLIVGNRLYHIYPLFPIPEAITCLKILKSELK